MLFQSQLYLVLLFVVVLASWGLAGHAALRLLLLLCASCLFYMSWEPWFIGLILASTLLDYFVALGLDRTPLTRPRLRKALLGVSLLGNLGLLGYFKYTNFFLQSFGQASTALGVPLEFETLSILLPVGISFYTFQTLSYSIDVYRREIPAERSLLKFSTYVTFFPQLVAGPIVRAVDFLPQLQRMPGLSVDDVSQGLFRIARGLVKKVCIADPLAVNLVDRAFSQPSLYSGPELMVALYAYSMQIYCDFSGYSDIAIGSARLMGYRLPENFDRPYAATTVAGFWRRWHITLSGWLRAYVFLPLGGSRGGVWRAHRNTMITLVLIGVWHGATWNFVLYGFLHGLAISVNRMLNRAGKTPKHEHDQPFWSIAWKVALTFHFVVICRILFRSYTWDPAVAYVEAMLDGGLGLGRIGAPVWATLAVAYGIHWTPQRWLDLAKGRFVALPAWGQGLALAGLAALMAKIAETEVVPFIYFQF